MARVPGRPTSIAVTVATQAFGTVLIFEKMFESRLFFTDKLVSHGRADHPLRPPPRRRQRPTQLFGSAWRAPTSARMSMLLASLCAEGKSTIGAVVPDRQGYERIDERLRALGARIERVTG